MSNFVRLFEDRFSEAVENGDKCQTIRQTPVRMPFPRDTISCRAWMGKPYRSKQRVLRESVITRVYRIVISNFGVRLNGVELCRSSLELLAVKDGFANSDEMIEWFDDHYDMPFEGIVICWEGGGE